MTPRQQMFAIFVSIALLMLVVELVRRKRLQEEYSWLWVLTSCMILLLTLWYRLLEIITTLIGAVLPTTTLFIFGILFLNLICLHFSVKMSQLNEHVKKLAQALALLEEEYRMVCQNKATRHSPSEGNEGICFTGTRPLSSGREQTGSD